MEGEWNEQAARWVQAAELLGPLRVNLPSEADVDQKKHTETTMTRQTIGPPRRHMILAMLRGKMQYPSTHTDWKNEMFPPRSSALTVTTCVIGWRGASLFPGCAHASRVPYPS